MTAVRTAPGCSVAFAAALLCVWTAAKGVDTHEMNTEPAISIHTISAALGVADVSVTLDDAAASPHLRVTLADGRRIGVPMIGGPERRWSARIMTGSPALEVHIMVPDASGHPREVGRAVRTLAVDPATATPDWAKGAVWYQVFVERFRNGNPANDPRPPEFFLAPWTSDWNSVTTEELELARARAAEAPYPVSLNPRRRGGQLGNVLNARRYGGDLEGLVEKLDDLQDLGVTALYLNPIFEAHSHHKYDATDFRHIDPSFGGNGRSDEERSALARETEDPDSWILTDADRSFLDVLIPEIRRRGMRIVLDGVWNHVGVRFWAFRDLLARGADSPYRDWFDAEFAGEATRPDWKEHQLDLRPGRLIAWKSWGDRNGNLPEFSRNRRTGRLHPDVERHIWAVTRRWTSVTDGWRLDVVPDVPLPFWRAWTDHARSINPEAALFAEVWFDAQDYFSPAAAEIGPGRIFDGQMNYPFAFAAVRWLAGEPEMPSNRLVQRLERVFSHAPQIDLVQMNLLGSHDTERLASMLANPGREYDQHGSPLSTRGYDDSRPSAEVYRRVALAAAMQALHLGSPMIYAGDEYGMYGADDPHCRKPLPWPDLGPFDDPAAAHEPGLREQFRAWFRLRSLPRTSPILRLGSIRYISTGQPDLLLFERRLNSSVLVAALNRSNTGSVDVAAWVPPDSSPVGPDRTPGFIVPPLGARAWMQDDGTPTDR